jgi:hypothetical protein
MLGARSRYRLTHITLNSGRLELRDRNRDFEASFETLAGIDFGQTRGGETRLVMDSHARIERDERLLEQGG